tara:strand:+ start:46 stop:942 length:897 start_codon:yes stop_codon:yes gene_type:complete
MKKDYLLNIFFILISYFALAQNSRIEIEIMNCTFSAFADKGLQYENLIKKYEEALINESFMEDAKGSNYRNVLKNIARGVYDTLPSINLATEMGKLDGPEYDNFEECNELSTAFTNYNYDKIYKIHEILDKTVNSKTFNPKFIAVETILSFTDEDFELSYYKLRVFDLFERLISRQLAGKIREEFLSKFFTTGFNEPLNLSLNDKSEIMVKNRVLNLTDLKDFVWFYGINNESISKIVLQIDNQSQIQIMNQVKETIAWVIDELRKKLAVDIFNQSIEELTEEQKNEIFKIYPDLILE